MGENKAAIKLLIKVQGSGCSLRMRYVVRSSFSTLHHKDMLEILTPQVFRDIFLTYPHFSF